MRKDNLIGKQCWIRFLKNEEIRDIETFRIIYGG
jgi:hypothetical protein